MKTCGILCIAFNEERLPLHAAACANDSTRVEKLLAEGADINAIDSNNWTPLHVATAYERKSIAEILIKNGANINAVGKFGNTPLFLAVITKNLEICELLISNGADVNTSRDDDGWSILHEAVEKSNIEIVILLLSKQVDINAKSKIDKTPLDWAKDQDVYNLLINNGALHSEEISIESFNRS
jgi:ankyrin repeat protein